MARIKKTALYYPEIAIPSGKWLRQAVLYFDEIASIVPSNLRLLTATEIERRSRRHERLPKNLVTMSEDVEILLHEGQYRPIHPEPLVNSYGIERDEFNDDFLSVLTSERFQRTLGDKRGWCFDVSINARKGGKDLFDLLIQEGYARPTQDDLQWVEFERSTAHLYMAMLAKHLARQEHDDTVPCTSGDESQLNDITFRIGDRSGGTCSADLLFENVLPCPNATTPLPDILDFKRRRRNELSRFRAEVSGLEATIATATGIEEVKNAVRLFVEKKDLALADLNKSFAESFVDGTLQSLRSLVRLGSPTLWLAGFAVAQHAISIQQLPPSLTMAGMAVTGSIELGLTFVERMRNRNEQFNKAAFSYVYYAERDLAKKPRQKKRKGREGR